MDPRAAWQSSLAVLVGAPWAPKRRSACRICLIRAITHHPAGNGMASTFLLSTCSVLGALVSFSWNVFPRTLRIRGPDTSSVSLSSFHCGHWGLQPVWVLPRKGKIAGSAFLIPESAGFVSHTQHKWASYSWPLTLAESRQEWPVFCL